MRVAQLYIYPIKSGPAVCLAQAEALERGLAHDRRFMVTDARGTFITQRSHPALGRIDLRIEGDTLHVDASGIGTCAVPLSPAEGPSMDVRVWSDTVRAHAVSTEADALFSAVVGAPSRLVYMPDQSRRPVEGFETHAVSFADGYPVLVTNTASLEDLGRRIEGPTPPMLAFRPNVVIDTDTAWAEDDWTVLRIGDAALECTTGCERCSVTTLDPALPGRPRPDGEPLRTLAKFRRLGGKVIFGRNAIVRSPGLMTAPGEVEVEVERR